MAICAHACEWSEQQRRKRSHHSSIVKIGLEMQTFKKHEKNKKEAVTFALS